MNEVVQSSSCSAPNHHQYLTFTLGGKVYAVGILNAIGILNIRGFMEYGNYSA